MNMYMCECVNQNNFSILCPQVFGWSQHCILNHIERYVEQILSLLTVGKTEAEDWFFVVSHSAN